MDPKATVEDAVRASTRGEWKRACELWGALDKWLNTGGFEPPNIGKVDDFHRMLVGMEWAREAERADNDTIGKVWALCSYYADLHTRQLADSMGAAELVTRRVELAGELGDWLHELANEGSLCFGKVRPLGAVGRGNIIRALIEVGADNEQGSVMSALNDYIQRNTPKYPEDTPLGDEPEATDQEVDHEAPGDHYRASAAATVALDRAVAHTVDGGMLSAVALRPWHATLATAATEDRRVLYAHVEVPLGDDSFAAIVAPMMGQEGVWVAYAPQNPIECRYAETPLEALSDLVVDRL